MELLKGELEHLLHADVGNLLDPTFARPSQADGKHHAQFASLGLLALGLERALAEQRQLELTHGALEAQQ